MKLTVSVVIATHNRKEDLQRTLETLAKLDPPPREILVCADGCTDGTVEFVKSLHQVRLLVNEKSIGSISSRNRLMREASSDLILSLDDDSFPVETDFIGRLGGLFEESPKLAVASFPQHSDEFPESLTQTDFGPALFVGSYASSGAAIRRRVFVELGEYPSFFFHAYEEPDFALRCVGAGWQVRHETSLHIRHCYSGVQRNEMRTHYFQARNELWSVWMRCPFPWLLVVSPFRVVRQFSYACKRGLRWVLHEPRWWLDCLRGLPDCVANRQPLSWARYWEWMKLVRNPVLAESELATSSAR